MTARNWLSPCADVWEARFGKGTFPGGVAGRSLKSLSAHHTPEEIAQRLAVYLDQTDPRYFSWPRFAMLFGSFAPQPLVDESGVLTAYGDKVTR